MSIKVKELIEELMRMPQDKDVFVCDGSHPVSIDCVYIDDDGDVAIQI